MGERQPSEEQKLRPRNQDSIPAPNDYSGEPSMWRHFLTFLRGKNQGKRRDVS